MEEVTKCKYIDCLDAREKEHILHELPVCDTSLCVRWLINSGHVDLIGKDLNALRSMKFFVCNNHFTEDCYLSKGTLKENAVPSPHWSNVSRTLKTAKERRFQKNQLNGQENTTLEVPTNRLSEKNCPSEFEVDQWCRTCATKKQNLVSMTTKGKGTEMSLLSKLKLLIEIDDEDALPTKMCDECVDKLEQSFKFFQQIYVADNTLRHVFPNTRLNSMPRKTLHSLGEHMRKEQTQKGKEKENENENDAEQQEHAPRVTRGGLFRRGRGRPRTRGYAGRARSRHRPGQVTMSIPSRSKEDNAIVSLIYDSSVKEPVMQKNGRRNETPILDEERQGGTVFSLLTDTCRSDEELDWSDVLKLMNCQQYRGFNQTEKLVKIEDNSETKMEKEATKTETTAKPERMGKEEMVAGDSTTEVNPNTETKSVAKGEGEVRNDRKTAKEYETRCIRCKFCKKTFRFRRQLQIHLVTDHPELSGYSCTDCSVSYESEFLLSKHRALRHGQRRYRCEHCQEEFLEKRILREHVNQCQPHDTSYYSCESCGVAFASKQILIEHMKCHCESTVASLQSDLGGSKVTDNASTSSSKLVQLEKDTQECCSAAVAASSNAVVSLESTPKEENTTTSSNRTLEINTEQHGRKEFASCPDCNEKVDDTVELSVHRMRCHSVKRKDTTCLLCDNKSFSTSEEYERHVLDHCKRLRVSP